jgi:type IV fimbrial biogenesis protein FimT
MPRNQTGLSLIEILLCLVILFVILMQGIRPGFFDARMRKQIDGLLQEMITLVAMARSQAINENVMVTLCRSDDGKRCEGNWLQGAIVFTDANGDRVINGNDRLLYRMEPVKVAGDLSFNSFQNRQFLQITPRGFTNYQNGNFTFCPVNKDARNAGQIIISLTGRARFATDRDGDGIVEDSQGRPLQCR